jgi:hypothetical protein
MTKLRKIFTYLPIIFLLLLTAPVAQAARLVPGSIPEQRSLQPMPLDVSPNYSENINTPPKETPAGKAPSEPQSQPGPSEQEPQTKPLSQKTTWPFAVIGGLALLGGLGYWMYKRAAKSKPRH